MSRPPKLRDDCFASPAGVAWTPVEQALARLRERMAPVVGVETVAIQAAAGRVLAEGITAPRANPPEPNSAVDGYGFCGPAPAGAVAMPLLAGRSAAGGPYGDKVPPGAAIRILTGAVLPEGVDTVVMQEDVAVTGARIAFDGPLKAGANARDAGEDVRRGDVIFSAGHRIAAHDLALLAAVGIGQVPVFARLRVGVLSTGDELIGAGSIAPEAMARGAIYDANRPMLLALLARWGFAAVDLGHAPDDLDALRDHLDAAVPLVDAIVTSGGASAGDEDHVSALLGAEGVIETWRIAMKPGRPLALGLWGAVPLFGLPGNPVAAFVCALIFARPALGRLAGARWHAPQGFLLPAGFTKDKKPGRAEFLRARVGADGRVEAFASEGSGRISGLSWAGGLVELDAPAQSIRPGDPVRFIPYGSFD